jgi:hypothetical protein
MQDWNYLVGKCMDITVEADDRKWPNADLLEQLFQVGAEIDVSSTPAPLVRVDFRGSKERRCNYVVGA